MSDPVAASLPMSGDCPYCGRPMADAADVDEAPGRVGHDSPDTSKVAALTPEFGSQRWRVLDALALLGPMGATAAQVAQRVGLTPNQTATRLGELREWGGVAYLRDSEGRIVKRTVPGRRPAQVQVITPAGERLLATRR